MLIILYIISFFDNLVNSFYLSAFSFVHLFQLSFNQCVLSLLKIINLIHSISNALLTLSYFGEVSFIQMKKRSRGHTIEYYA